MAKPDAGTRFDWGIALLTIWVVVGFYLDLWAHAHGMVDDTFLTPWHAILYAGAATFGLTLGVLATRNLMRGAPWRSALPGPYMVSLVGALASLVAGQFDFVWHSMFGFEGSVEALLSPPHLALAACGILAFSGPIRSVWARPTTAPSWRRHGPAVIGLTAMLSLFAAFTQYAHPVDDPLAGPDVGPTIRAPRSQLYAMAADGTGQHRIAISDADERNPELSPDGRHLAFSAFADESAQIVVSDPDGSNRRPITTEGNNARPAWSPDGSRLAFHSDRAGSLDIYTMAADGTDVRRVTAEASSEFGPTWSPDGTRIAFASDRDGATEIYAADADGADVVRLTNGGAGDPAWSPDGSRIAFAAEGADGDADVFSMAIDGTDVRRLTDAVGSSYLPAWSPDGASIAFATDRDGDLEVYVMRADGSDQRNLTRSAGIRDGWFGPSWSPDGRTILYPSQGEIPASRGRRRRRGTRGGEHPDPGHAAGGLRPRRAAARVGPVRRADRARPRANGAHGPRQRRVPLPAGGAAGRVACRPAGAALPVRLLAPDRRGHRLRDPGRRSTPRTSSRCSSPAASGGRSTSGWGRSSSPGSSGWSSMRRCVGRHPRRRPVHDTTGGHRRVPWPPCPPPFPGSPRPPRGGSPSPRRASVTPDRRVPSGAPRSVDWPSGSASSRSTPSTSWSARTSCRRSRDSGPTRGRSSRT